MTVLSDRQIGRLRDLLEPVLASNAFYRRKLNAAGVHAPGDIRTLDDYRALPFTTRGELSEDQDTHPRYGTNLTFPSGRYVRLHQTSGTTGRRLRWLDTASDWQGLVESWVRAYQVAGVSRDDRVFVAFSFGPFIGFWCAFEAAQRLGALTIPGGAMSSEERARCLVENDVTVLACTPTYALRLAQVARQVGVDVAATAVRTTIHGGEPGASIPATRRRIAEAWGASCFDHVGATEVGSWGFDCGQAPGIHVDESDFVWEVIDPATGVEAREGELVLTNLARVGMPILRYRTGDRVRVATDPCPCGRTAVRFEGGVLGRVDEALVIRGIVVFPSAIEDAVRRFAEVVEYAIDVETVDALDVLSIRVELTPGAEDISADVADTVRVALGLNVGVTPVAAGTLPRFESKARRVTDRRVRGRE